MASDPATKGNVIPLMKGAQVAPFRAPSGVQGSSDPFQVARACAEQIGRLARRPEVRLPKLVDSLGVLASYATATAKTKEPRTTAAMELLTDLVKAAGILRRAYNKRVGALHVENMQESWKKCGYMASPQQEGQLRADGASPDPVPLSRIAAEGGSGAEGFWQFMSEQRAAAEQHLDEIHSAAWRVVVLELDPKKRRYPRQFRPYARLVTAALGRLPKEIEGSVSSWRRQLQREATKSKPDSFEYHAGAVLDLVRLGLPPAQPRKDRRPTEAPTTPALGGGGA